MLSDETIVRIAFMETVILPAELAALRMSAPTFEQDSALLQSRMRALAVMAGDDDQAFLNRFLRVNEAARRIKEKCR